MQDSTLQHYTGYKPSELRECVVGIHEIQCNTKNCTLPAIREKYRQHKVILKCKLHSGFTSPPNEDSSIVNSLKYRADLLSHDGPQDLEDQYIKHKISAALQR